MTQPNSRRTAEQKWKQVLKVPGYNLELPREVRDQYDSAAVDYISNALESGATPRQISKGLRNIRDTVNSSEVTWTVNVPGKDKLKNVKQAGTRAWNSGAEFYDVNASRQSDGSYVVKISGTPTAYREFSLHLNGIQLNEAETDLAKKETDVERKAIELDDEKERMKASRAELEQQDEESKSKAKEIAKLMGLAKLGDQIYEDAQYRSALGKLETSPKTRKIASRGEYLQEAFEAMAGKPWHVMLAESQEQAEGISSKVLLISSALAELSDADKKILRAKTGAKNNEEFYRADKYASVFSNAAEIRDAPKASLRKFWNYDARAFSEALGQVSEEDRAWINASRKKGKNNFVYDVPAEVAKNFLGAYEKALGPTSRSKARKLYEAAEAKEKHALEMEQGLAGREQKVSEMEQKMKKDFDAREEQVSDIEQRAYATAESVAKSAAKREIDIEKRDAALKKREVSVEKTLGETLESAKTVKNYLKDRITEERSYLDRLSKKSGELGIVQPEKDETFGGYFGRFLDAVSGLKPRKKRQYKEGSYDFVVDKDGSFKIERKKPVAVLKPREKKKLAEGAYSLTVGKDGSYKFEKKTEAPKVVEQTIVEAKPVVRIQRSGVEDLFYATSSLEDLKKHPMKTFIDGLSDKEFSITDEGVRLRNPRDKLVRAFKEAGYEIKNVRKEKPKPPIKTPQVAPPKITKRVLKHVEAEPAKNSPAEKVKVLPELKITKKVLKPVDYSGFRKSAVDVAESQTPERIKKRVKHDYSGFNRSAVDVAESQGFQFDITLETLKEIEKADKEFLMKIIRNKRVPVSEEEVGFLLTPEFSKEVESRLKELGFTS